ncbi:MAG: FAD-binding protein [Bacteroidales bacterium]|jgi:uncharacterized FAD-dependent dehydrogenase|nr:FAD-binding protein [Bacteroidales bacterium]
MITEIEIKLLPDQKDDEFIWREKIAKALKISSGKISGVKILRQSLDARSRTPFYQTLFSVYTFPDTVPEQSFEPVAGAPRLARPIVTGTGPAGLFAAITLVENGYSPIILEQGKKVDERKKDIVLLQRDGVLNPLSNYCFGEGGAGCFSDGKLYTRSNKRGSIEKVLQTFIYFGASPSILYEAHPHIGSDKLPAIITAMRKWLESKGCEFYFDSRVVDFVIRDERCVSVVTASGQQFDCDNIILATGHSSNNIYNWFYEHGYALEAKPFALGVRVEHPQELINRLQYGSNDNLPPAEYKFAEQVGQRGVFSFCMCPGGVLVPSMTEQETLVLNGMSASARSSRWANSGMVVTVSPADYYEGKVIDGLVFRSELEKKFFMAATPSVTTSSATTPAAFRSPAQRITDFLQNDKSKNLPRSSYSLGLYESNLNTLLPSFVSKALQQAFKQIDKKRKGFITSDAIITGLESRTSSPVRIMRNSDTFSHPNIVNLYPCGEGAGYAGGITSSAMDGINSAMYLIKNSK